MTCKRQLRDGYRWQEVAASVARQASLSDDDGGNEPIQPTKESQGQAILQWSEEVSQGETDFEEVDELESDAGEGGDVWMRVTWQPRSAGALRLSA